MQRTRSSRRTSATITVGLVLAMTGAAASAASYGPTVTSTPGLVGYFQFNGNYNSSVNGYTGAATAGTSIGAPGTGPAIADQPANRPVVFSGTGGNAVNSNIAGGISTAGTILAWINLAQLPSTAGRIFYVAGESAGANDFDVQIQTDNRIYFYTDNGGSVSSPAALTAADLNQWIFVAATFSSNNDRDLYINGVPVATNVPGGHGANAAPFTIGYSPFFGGRAFNGSIDEVAVYNTELTANQVAAIFASRTVVPEPAMLSAIGILALSTLRRRR